jgi:hypothetical protein
MASWGCPHEVNGVCQKVNELPCDPGMKGCVLFGRFTFSNPAKNRPPRPGAEAGKGAVGQAARSGEEPR